MKKNPLVFALLSGVFFGLGVVVILGIYLLVHAVGPGVVQNPTFGPQDDDVDLTGLCPPGQTYSLCTQLIDTDGSGGTDCTNQSGATNYLQVQHNDSYLSGGVVYLRAWWTCTKFPFKQKIVYIV